ncbi:MAG: cation transporter [Deltaproteobacteria bacterium]|nr:cation transporter [Deltaproteobacteria bacterium]
MSVFKPPQSSSIRFRKGTADHWKNAKELNQVLHSLPGYFRAVLLDLIDNPMTSKELMTAIKNIEMQMSGNQKRKFQKTDVKKDIDFAINCSVLEKISGKYVLTPGGLEIAQHMKEVIPLFFNTLLSTRTVTLITIIIHILLSVVKLVFGFLSQSAGLIADGIDNTVDTISSILVWFGIKYQKDKIASLFIIIMMAASVVGIVITGINKVLHTVPVKEGFIAFVASAISGFVMLLLSAYQYITGKKTANFSILCQSVDSRNHFLTSLLVCAGILTSYIADVFTQSWLYYSDAIVAIIIGILIAKGTFELIIEFLKPEDEATGISHFVEKARKKMEMKIVYQWLSSELKERSMSYKELHVRFEKQFCEQTPTIHTLTGIGYLPKTRDELRYFLAAFSEKKKIIIKDNKYSMNF